MTKTLSSESPCVSMHCMASSIPFSVRAFLLVLSSTNSSASFPASTSSFVFNKSNAFFAVSSLPLAFRHGPSTNPIWYAFIPPKSSLLDAIRERMPILFVWFSRFKPSFTKIRFSCWSSMTSPIVANAAFSIKTSACFMPFPVIS